MPVPAHRSLSAAQTLQRAAGAAEVRQLRFHALRHSAGSLIAREADARWVQGFLGHSKLATTERYLHAKPRRQDVERLNRAFGAGTATRSIETVEMSSSQVGGLALAPSPCRPGVGCESACREDAASVSEPYWAAVARDAGRAAVARRRNRVHSGALNSLARDDRSSVDRSTLASIGGCGTADGMMRHDRPSSHAQAPARSHGAAPFRAGSRSLTRIGQSAASVPFRRGSRWPVSQSELAPAGASAMRLCRYAGLDAHPRFKLERSALHASPSFVGTIASELDRLPAH